MRWRRARDEQEPRPERDEWGAELFDEASGPHEAGADERLGGRAILNVDAARLYDRETQEFIFLLAHLVARLGGAVVLTREDREKVYSLGVDHSEMQTTGNLRLFSILQGEDA